MIHFKQKAVEELLAQHKSRLDQTTFQQIKKTIDRGAKGLDPYTLSLLCRDLQCMPVDIVEFD